MVIRVGEGGVGVGVGLGVGVNSCPGVGEAVGVGVGEGLCAKALPAPAATMTSSIQNAICRTITLSAFIRENRILEWMPGHGVLLAARYLRCF